MANFKLDVTANGENHTITVKGKKISVDNGTPIKAKSKNMWIQLFDEAVEINGKTFHVVTVGNKVDVATDGVYLISNKKYLPASEVSGSCKMWMAVDCVLGFFTTGLIGLVIGVIAAQACLKNEMSDNEGKATKNIIYSLISIAINVVVCIFFVLPFVSSMQV